MATDVVLRPEEQAVHGLELAERVFTPSRRKAIARFLNVEADDPAMVPYLASCASYGLDPVMGQIWLIPQRVKVRVQDGDVVKQEYQERYRPAVGRDGYLAIARRDPRYRGLKGTVVCEFDSFEVFYDGSEDEPKVLHRFAGKPVVFEDGVNPARWRGRVLGAWAKAYAAGQPPMFYFAPINEHIRMREKWEGSGSNRHRVTDESGRVVLEPDGAWGYVSTMIQKAAQSYVLRIQFGITGLVPVDEIPDGAAGADASSGVIDVEAVGEADASQFTDDPELAARLDRAIERVNELAPLSWPPAKVEMLARGLSDDDLAVLALRIESEADLLAQRAVRAQETRPRPAAGDSPSEGPSSAEGRTEREPIRASDHSEAEVQRLSEEIPDADVVPDGPRTVAPENTERLAMLDRRQRELEDALNDPSLLEHHQVELAAELDAVENEIRALTDPGQGSLL